MVSRHVLWGAPRSQSKRPIALMAQRSTGSLKGAIWVENRSQMGTELEWCLKQSMNVWLPYCKPQWFPFAHYVDWKLLPWLLRPGNPCHSSWDHGSCLPMCLSSHFSTGFFCPLKCAVCPLEAFVETVLFACPQLFFPCFFPPLPNCLLLIPGFSLAWGGGWFPGPPWQGGIPWMYP